MKETQITIDRDLKIMLLGALRRGYFSCSDLDTLNSKLGLELNEMLKKTEPLTREELLNLQREFEELLRPADDL